VAREKTLHWWLLAQAKGKTTNRPRSVEGLRANLQRDNAVRLTWNIPTVDSTMWYFKIFRDNKLLTEIDGDVSDFTDNDLGRGIHQYQVITVNYNFKESSPSSFVNVTVP
jgi:hypothetical protein